MPRTGARRLGPRGLSLRRAAADTATMRSFVLGLVAVSLTVAAISVVPNGATAPLGAPNPCRLVTATDVKAVLGAAVGRGKLQTLGLYRSCTYRTKSFATVTVQTRAISKADFVRSAKANPPPVKVVGGLGRPAYFAGGVTLLVWRAGSEATFSIFGSGPALTREVELAKRALPRL